MPFLAYAERPNAIDTTQTVTFYNDENDEEYELDVTGHFCLSSCAMNDPWDYSLDDWDYDNLEDMPEYLQKEIRAGKHDGLICETLISAELV